MTINNLIEDIIRKQPSASEDEIRKILSGEYSIDTTKIPQGWIIL